MGPTGYGQSVFCVVRNCHFKILFKNCQYSSDSPLLGDPSVLGISSLSECRLNGRWSVVLCNVTPSNCCLSPNVLRGVRVWFLEIMFRRSVLKGPAISWRWQLRHLGFKGGKNNCLFYSYIILIERFFCKSSFSVNAETHLLLLLFVHLRREIVIFWEADSFGQKHVVGMLVKCHIDCTLDKMNLTQNQEINHFKSSFEKWIKGTIFLVLTEFHTIITLFFTPS